MKTFGVLLLICGALALVAGFGMDTTVPTGLGEGRVHNIGLINQKQNVLLLGAALAVVGALFVGFAGRNSSSSQGSDAETCQCPYCAEVVKKRAVVCRFCNRDLPAAVSSAGGDADDALEYWPHTWKRRPK